MHPFIVMDFRKGSMNPFWPITIMKTYNDRTPQTEHDYGLTGLANQWILAKSESPGCRYEPSVAMYSSEEWLLPLN